MSSTPLIAVVDYGIGNLHSAHKSLEHCGAAARLTADRSLIADADGVVLPGVGAFGACMDALRQRDLDGAVLDAVASGRPFLGICVGTQMLFDTSAESPGVAGLGVIPGEVVPIPPIVGYKIPQMQWNRLDVVADDPLLAGLDDGRQWLYFVHSLHAVPADPATIAATCDYGTTLNAAFRRDNVFAAQFHPEKSSAAGLRMLTNFVAACAASPRGDR